MSKALQIYLFINLGIIAGSILWRMRVMKQNTIESICSLISSKTIHTSVLLLMLMSPVSAQSQRLNTSSNLSCSLESEKNKSECEVKPKDLSSPRILQEMMHIYRQQSQPKEVSVLAQSLKLEF